MKNSSFLASRWTYLREPGFVLLVFSLASASSGATLSVAKKGSNHPSCGAVYAPCLTIQYAIDQRAAAGDVILIDPGSYTELITIDKNLTLLGPTWKRAVIDGGGTGTVVTVPPASRRTWRF